MPFASPAFAPCLSSCSKRMLPFAPPQVGHDVTDASNVPESCHASRTRNRPAILLEDEGADRLAAAEQLGAVRRRLRRRAAPVRGRDVAREDLEAVHRRRRRRRNRRVLDGDRALQPRALEASASRRRPRLRRRASGDRHASVFAPARRKRTAAMPIKNGWFYESEVMWPGQAMGLKVEEVLHESRPTSRTSSCSARRRTARCSCSTA